MPRRNRSAGDTPETNKNNIVALARRPYITDPWRNRIENAWAQCADGNRDNEETPRQIVGHDNERIDSSRWVKTASQMHCHHCQTNRHGRGPLRWSTYLDHKQAYQSGQQMTANQGAWLCWTCLG